MRFSKLMFLFAAAAFWAGCEDPQQAEQAAWDNMMEVHDEVMPKMAEMNRTGRELKSSVDSTADKTTQEQVNLAVKSLESSSEAMMVWMGELQQLSKLRESKSHEEILQYLRTEQEEIDSIGDEMISSLEKGQALLKELQAQQN